MCPKNGVHSVKRPQRPGLQFRRGYSRNLRLPHRNTHIIVLRPHGPSKPRYEWSRTQEPSLQTLTYGERKTRRVRTQKGEREVYKRLSVKRGLDRRSGLTGQTKRTSRGSRGTDKYGPRPKLTRGSGYSVCGQGKPNRRHSGEQGQRKERYSDFQLQ